MPSICDFFFKFHLPQIRRWTKVPLWISQDEKICSKVWYSIFNISIKTKMTTQKSIADFEFLAQQTIGPHIQTVPCLDRQEWFELMKKPARSARTHLATGSSSGTSSCKINLPPEQNFSFYLIHNRASLSGNRIEALQGPFFVWFAHRRRAE